MRLHRIFERREVWSIGIYKVKSREEIFELGKSQPLYMIGEKGFRKNLDYQSTVADPFLFRYGGGLYLFYEVQTEHGHGEIWARSLSKEGDWVSHGKVLGESFHLSYPQVLEHQGRVYMLPEAAQSGKVVLYSSVDFPVRWEPCSTLVAEPLLDPTIYFRNGEGFFLLGTTRDYELKLYHSTAIEQPFSATGVTISSDKSVSRGAGSLLDIDGLLFRPAQDCTNAYGKRVRLLEIKEFSVVNYREELSFPDLYPVRPGWMSLGCHHLSSAEFNGAVYVAVDGRRKDRYINTLLLALLKVRERFQDIVNYYDYRNSHLR